MKKKFNHNLEALRGFAALSVFIYHAIINTEFNNGYDIRLNFFPYAPPGHLMVLIFFVLSGYVIGITNNSNSVFSIKSYCQKRIVRLYPVYVVSILITVLLFKENTINILGNFLFLQNLIVDNLVHNKALWSLNHEIIYYLLAIPILYFRIKPLYVLLLILPLLGFSLIVSPFPCVLEAYLVGFFFWMTGLWLSSQKMDWTPRINEMLSVLIFLLGYDYLNVISVALHSIPLKHNSCIYLQGLVNFEDFSLWLGCVYACLVFTGIQKRLCSILFYVVYASSFIHLGYLLVSGSFFKTQVFMLPAILICVSFLIYYIKSINTNLRAFEWMGGLSYAMYVIHAPILLAFEYVPFWGGNTTFFFLRLGILIVIVLFISYILEKKMQPYIKNKLLPNKKMIGS